MLRADLGRRPKVALLWAQFAAYHIDRCEAVARSLGAQIDLYAVEVATASDTYAWEPSGSVVGCEKVTIFPGRNVDSIGPWEMFRRQLATLRQMDVVFFGVSYAVGQQLAVAMFLRVLGVRVVMMNDSKYDDSQRSIWTEALKPIAMLPYNAAIVGGERNESYLRFLGFKRRRILQGYDTVSIDRLREQGRGIAPPDGPDYANRPFVFVGRFVPKKNVPVLIRAYKEYFDLAGPTARKLLLVGSGPLEGEIRELVSACCLNQQVTFTGFLGARDVARTLAGGLCLILPSREEQWGLVVNEATALGLPVIVSENVGARDSLVRNLVNGFVIEKDSVEGLARAMCSMSNSRADWERMVAASTDMAYHGDSKRFAKAVSALITDLR